MVLDENNPDHRIRRGRAQRKPSGLHIISEAFSVILSKVRSLDAQVLLSSHQSACIGHSNARQRGSSNLLV